MPQTLTKKLFRRLNTTPKLIDLMGRLIPYPHVFGYVYEVYALGVLKYETLQCKFPSDGSTMKIPKAMKVVHWEDIDAGMINNDIRTISCLLILPLSYPTLAAIIFWPDEDLTRAYPDKAARGTMIQIAGNSEHEFESTGHQNLVTVLGDQLFSV